MEYWTTHLFMRLHDRIKFGSSIRFRSFYKRVARGSARSDHILRLVLKDPMVGLIYLREVDSGLTSFSEIFVENIYATVLSNISSCRRIIDLGANLGLASISFATHYPQTTVVPVEPHPDNYRMLLRNLERLIISGRCHPLQAAGWSEVRSLVADPSTSNGPYNAFAVCEAREASTAPRITGTTISRILEEMGWEGADLVKMDIEGAEIEVFRGNLGWLKKIRAIAIEFHGDSRRLFDFYRIARRTGFRVDENPHTVVAFK